MLAGFLSDPSNNSKNSAGGYRNIFNVDPLVVSVLARESVEVQRAVIGILSLLKAVAYANKNEHNIS
jgi:hypothetical protein